MRYKLESDHPVTNAAAKTATGKTTLMVNHTPIQTRAEADGLRAAWAEALDQLKGICEG